MYTFSFFGRLQTFEHLQGRLGLSTSMLLHSTEVVDHQNTRSKAPCNGIFLVPLFMLIALLDFCLSKKN